MARYWWVNQSDQYEKERAKSVIAARISETTRPTHWGRANVQNIDKGNFIVCYRSGVG